MRQSAPRPLVGRDELRDELVSVADLAERGSGSVVLLTGEAGIGKTTVARWLAQRVRAQLAVSWGVCVADQSAPPFWPWRALVEPESADPLHATDPAVGVPRFEQLIRMHDRLRDAATQRPRLHVIEDLQWADVASVLLLAQLGAAIADMPLLVVVTLRTGEPSAPPLGDAIEDVERVSRVRQLAAFDGDDISALIRRDGADPDRRLVDVIRTRTGGNPLFVHELLSALPLHETAEQRLETIAELVPERVADLVLRRLRRLPDRVVDVLVTASVLGAEGDTATLAIAHGLVVASLLELLDQARAAHLLDAAPPGRWQFRHQIIRDSVYASVPAAERARRHARVLEALSSDPSTPLPAVARHALAAQPFFDPDRAVALAARAGESAFSHHAYEEAVEWFTRALAAAPPGTAPRWRADLLLLCGEAQRHIGDIAGARQAFIRAGELTDEPALLARAALGYADPGADLGIAYRSDDAVTAQLLERAIGTQPAADAVTTVQLEARLAAELYFSEEPSRARELAEAAVDRARRLDDAAALGAAVAVHHDAFVVGQADFDRQLEDSLRLVDWARASGSVTSRLTAHRARVLDLLAAGDLAAMDGEVLAFRRIADPLRVPAYRWWPALWSAMRALLEGRHDIAEERALAAYQTGAAPFPSLSFFNLSFLLFFLRREQGRLGEMEAPTRDYAASHADVPALRVALTFLLAELQRVDEARAMLGSFDDHALARLRDRNWPASWFQLARAASITGERHLATRLLEPRHRPSERCVQVSLATVCLGSTDLAVAWLFHTVGDLEAADGLYRSAAACNARIGAVSWLAQTRADHARLLMERNRPGDRDEAARLLALAQRVARQIGLATVSADPPVRAASPAVFHRHGSVWELAFADRTTQLPDARGLHDLAFLISRSGASVSVLELANDAGSTPAGARGAEALDERARREIRARLHELDDDEAEAEAMGDDEAAALARARRQALAEAVARDFGLAGRSRRIGDPVERARKTVSTRIRRAITTIGRVHPELGRHLERSIDTGAWCAYRPAEPIDWHL